MNLETVVIQPDYLQGAIWISDQKTGEPLTGIDVIIFAKGRCY